MKLRKTVEMSIEEAQDDFCHEQTNCGCCPLNEPLTIEQLREMDGEPVWIVDIGGRNWYGPGCAIVDRENNLVRTVKNWNPVFFEKYGERWLAYCRPPERQEDT